MITVKLIDRKGFSILKDIEFFMPTIFVALPPKRSKVAFIAYEGNVCPHTVKDTWEKLEFRFQYRDSNNMPIYEEEYT